MKMKKGQGAMEYLMTYGWAILVVLIVGIVLWKTGLFGTSATGQSGFDVLVPAEWKIANGVNNAFVYGTKAEITTGNTITLTPQTDGWSANTGNTATGPEQIVENARLYLKLAKQREGRSDFEAAARYARDAAKYSEQAQQLTKNPKLLNK